MYKYEEVHVPTTHLKPSNWERLCWKWEKLTFYAYLSWSRYLWFVTRHNLIGLIAVIFVASLMSRALRSGILVNNEFIYYERTMAPIELMGSRLDAFEKERMVWELQYNEKIRHLEEIVRKSLSEIQSETQKLHAEIQQCKFINNEFTRNATMTFQSYVASQIKDLEVEVNNQLAYIESRVVTTNDHQSLTFTNCCSIEFTRMSCWEPSEHVMARKYSVNLASRSHGAFVVPHLTSKPVTSGSLLHTIFDAIFGLETYNFAITERTHIIPSEAFCFHGSEGNLTIRLWTNATVDAIEYEHDYWRNLVPISAPKRYDVIACIDHECKESVRLSECTYPSDYKEGPAQICHMTNLSITTDQVQLVFKTNHGQEYTCIYQLRVLSWK